MDLFYATVKYKLYIEISSEVIKFLKQIKLAKQIFSYGNVYLRSFS